MGPQWIYDGMLPSPVPLQAILCTRSSMTHSTKTAKHCTLTTLVNGLCSWGDFMRYWSWWQVGRCYLVVVMKTSGLYRFIFGNRFCFKCLEVFMASKPVPYVPLVVTIETRVSRGLRSNFSTRTRDLGMPHFRIWLFIIWTPGMAIVFHILGNIL